MWPLDVFGEPVWQRLTWTLLHFLWQGLAVAAVLATVLWLFRIRQARARYALGLLAMLLMAVCPLVTFAVMQLGADRGVEIARRGWEAVEPVPTGASPQMDSHPDPGGRAAAAGSARPTKWSPGVAAGQPLAIDGPVAAREVGFRPGRRFMDHARTLQPYVLLAWMGGVTLLALRLLVAQLGVHWLRRHRCSMPPELTSRMAELGRRLGLRSAPRVFGCDRLAEAIVVGLLRPMVLLPACWLTEMTPEVLEAVVAHELAHVRRWDLWVNLLQRLVETLLFYHPAVWWVSRRVRLEREMCCDELAVSATGERVAYATALELAARQRTARAKPLLGVAMGGTKMTLLNRVRHVLGLSPTRQRARWWPVGILALLVPLAIWLTSTGLGFMRGGEELAPGLKQSARLAITLELTTLHWQKLEDNGGYQRLVETLTEAFRKDPRGSPWTVRFFLPDPADPERAELDEFEVEALAEIKAGKDEVWHRTAEGEVRYARALRATDKSCVVCHAMIHRPAKPEGDRLKENDVLGVASLTLVVNGVNATEDK